MSFPTSTYPFFPNLPNAPDYPGDDQPGMQTNTTSTSSSLSVDHVGFNTASTGTHKQMSFLAAVVPPTVTGTQSVMYPGNIAGGTSPYATQIAPLYKNAQGTVVLGAVNAFVNFSNNGTITSQFNVGSVTVSVNKLNITVNFSNALPSANYTYQIVVNDPNALAYGQQILTPTTGTFPFRVLFNTWTSMSIVILGA